MLQAPSEVYVRCFPIFSIYTRTHNNLPLEYRNKGTSNGDFGIIKPNGSFSFVFSICTPLPAS
jgi:hypothetical protein